MIMKSHHRASDIYSKSPVRFFKGFSTTVFPWLIFLLISPPSFDPPKMATAPSSCSGQRQGIALIPHSVGDLTCNPQHILKALTSSSVSNISENLDTFHHLSGLPTHCQGPLSGSL